MRIYLFKTRFFQKYKSRVVTEDVKKIARFVQENCEKVGNRYGKSAQQNRLTLNMLVDIFLGKKPCGISPSQMIT